MCSCWRRAAAVMTLVGVAGLLLTCFARLTTGQRAAAASDEGDTEMNTAQEKDLSVEAQRKLLRIARQSAEAAVRGERVPEVKFDDDPELSLRRGAFVTLTNRGRLRGCIGEFEPRQPVALVVRDMAIASATQDARFASDPITPQEMKGIEVEISVLSPRRRLKNPLDFELGKDGIYIRRGSRAGTFLPQVATEYNMTKEEFLSTCCTHKAGLAPDSWKDPQTEVYAYRAQVFSEHDLAKQ